jgi:hypothetical protein
MRSPRRRLPVALAAVLAVATVAITAATLPGPAGQGKAVAGAAVHARGVVRVLHRGLVRDCEYIQGGGFDAGLQIIGHGVNRPVTLTTETGVGSCFNLYNPFYFSTAGHTYKGYEYQDLAGHCLWDNGGTIEVGAACKAAHPREEFYGIKLTKGEGWTFSDVADGPAWNMAVAYSCSPGYSVFMEPAGAEDCNYWNFPQSGT